MTVEDRPNSERKMQTTSLHLPADLLYLLRIVAVRRASQTGGRPSVSDVVRDVLEDHRHELETEASPSSEPGGADYSGYPHGSEPPHGALRTTPTERNALQRATRAAKSIRRRPEKE